VLLKKKTMTAHQSRPSGCPRPASVAEVNGDETPILMIKTATTRMPKRVIAVEGRTDESLYVEMPSCSRKGLQIYGAL